MKSFKQFVIENNTSLILAYHGSRNDILNIKSDNINEFGVHFGTKDQAKAIADLKGGVVRAYYLNIKNPLYTIDFPRWEGYIMSKILHKYDIITEYEMNLVHNAKNKDKILRNILINKGYDGIVYDNAFEGEGKSYIPFSLTQVSYAD